ncbi:MAG: hydroxymethylpyrimidine/phosphomethylpyrimidine kinase [Flavobacteriales bacterium]
MAKQRVNVLSIAGFDPSGGAGILADIKTFEQHKCLGMAAQTAFTIQNEHQVEEVFWHAKSKILAQLDILTKVYVFKAVKIGLCRDLEMLNLILNYFQEHAPKTKLIWDPILSSSSGFDVFNKEDIKHINYDLIDWITPNWNEAKALFSFDDNNLIDGILNLKLKIKVLLKGGHRPDALAKDVLISKGKCYPFKAKTIAPYGKHGSGCIFSSSLASLVAQNYPDIKAVLKAKSYTSRCLHSNTSGLAYHKT